MSSLFLLFGLVKNLSDSPFGQTKLLCKLTDAFAVIAALYT